MVLSLLGLLGRGGHSQNHNPRTVCLLKRECANISIEPCLYLLQDGLITYTVCCWSFNIGRAGAGAGDARVLLSLLFACVVVVARYLVEYALPPPLPTIQKRKNEGDRKRKVRDRVNVR